MKSLLLFAIVASANASWFSTNNYGQDQYSHAQKVFTDNRENVIKEWDDSKLRQFLVDQGILNPSGPRESLESLAKNQYAFYTSYASAASASVSSVLSENTHKASSSLESAASSASSLAAQATTEVTRKFDSTKDYIFSNWSDSELKAYLQKKGIVPTEKTNREKLIEQLRGSYQYSWEAWTDSYIHDWLVAHNLIRSEQQKQRDEYVGLMKDYFYDVNSYVWDTWSDSQLRGWLVDHKVLKPEAVLRRDKMVKLVKDQYSDSLDTIYGGWTDSQIREWLVSNGYLKSNAEKKGDDLLRLFNEKYATIKGTLNGKAEAYLVWPDARLRAYLREHDYDEQKILPGDRSGLLQEVRIKWVQGSNKVGGAYAKLREMVCSGVEFAEEKIGAALSILTGTVQEARKYEKKTAANLVKEYEVELAKAEKEYVSASADLIKHIKDAKAEVVKEKEQKVADAKFKVSSLSAELARESKRAFAEL